MEKTMKVIFIWNEKHDGHANHFTILTIGIPYSNNDVYFKVHKYRAGDNVVGAYIYTGINDN